MCDKKAAKELIFEAKENLAISGAAIISAQEEMEEINKRSQENIKKLSFLL